jgi:predicted ATPase with chaperone activity
MPFEFDKCLERGRKMRAQGVSEEDLLQFFRQEGASMLESARLIRQLKSISLREAQDLIHFSKTWADLKESHENLQEVFAEALQQLSRETHNKSS